MASPIKYQVPTKVVKAYRSLRLWAETYEKLRRLSDFFQLTMTEFVDSLADQMIVQYMEDPVETEKIRTRSNHRKLFSDDNPPGET